MKVKSLFTSFFIGYFKSTCTVYCTTERLVNIVNLRLQLIVCRGFFKKVSMSFYCNGNISNRSPELGVKFELVVSLQDSPFFLQEVL